MANTANQLIPVILCGGEGSRLWPLSRQDHPKPFLQLPTSSSLLQHTFRRAQLPNVTEILTVALDKHVCKIQAEYESINGHKCSSPILVEPSPKNTAPAIAAAASLIKNRWGENTLLLVLPSDHLISDQKSFESAVAKAMEIASTGRIVTFGIQPKTPETGYGYIESHGDKVSRFIEKPSRQEAQRFIESGNFLWNAGILCFQAGTMLKELRAHCPDILDHVTEALDGMTESFQGEIKIWELASEAYKQLKPDSIDYALMEKTQVASVVPCDLDWNDIGTWTSYGQLLPEDESGNHISGNVVQSSSENCIIHSSGRLVAALGLKDILIADTPDAVLVASKESAQSVKALHSAIRDSHQKEVKEHAHVSRPWGSYKVLEDRPGYKVKRIEVAPGKKLSLQSHQHRSETWVIIQGKAKVTKAENESILNPNESIFIPPQCKHRLENIGEELLIVLEVQMGSYLEEDDIERFEDDYRRTGTS